MLKFLPLILLALLSSCSTDVKRLSREEAHKILSKKGGMEKFLDHLAEENLINNQVVGMVIGVTTPKGTKFYAYGYKNKEKKIPMTTDAIFQIGSISKVFTASLLTVMADENYLSIDDPLKKFMKKDFNPRTKWVADITLESMAAHFSGLTSEYQNIKMLKSAIKFLWTGENIWKDLNEKELWAFVEEYNFGYQEAKRFRYSNIAYVTLGGVLGKIIPGKTYDVLIKEKITEPLGLYDTVFHLNDDQKLRLATGYSGSAPPFMKRGVHLPPWEFQAGLDAAGGLYSSAPDLMKFLLVNMNDHETSLGKSFKKNHQPKIKFSKGYIGMGWFLETLPRSLLQKIYHNGIISGYTSYVGFHPESKIGVVVLQNTMNMNYEFGERLLDELLLGRE